jgi:hypothetical protein
MLGQNFPMTPWDQLQEPRRAAGRLTGFLRLLAALDAGWRIDLAGLRFLPGDEGNGVFLFRLVHAEDHQSHTLQLPHTRELEQLLNEEQRRFQPMQYGFADPDRLWDD